MGKLESTGAVAARAVTQLRREQGPPKQERTLALLIAIPRDASLRSSVQNDVAAAGGTMLTRRDALIATFSTVTGALECARVILKSGTEPSGAVAVAIHHATVRVDESGIPVSDALQELVTLAGVAQAGMLVVAGVLLPHLGTAHTARLTKGDGLDAHELAWRDGQSIGHGLRLPAIAAMTVAIAALGIFGARAYDDWQRGREEEARMLTETAFLADGGMGMSRLAMAPPVPETPEPPPVPGGNPPPPPEVEEPPRKRAPVRRMGALTLVVRPSAEVRFKGKSLGKTPLFKVPLEAGNQRLELEGADGKRRVLHVPIKVKETTALRLKLDEIPEG